MSKLRDRLLELGADCRCGNICLGTILTLPELAEAEAQAAEIERLRAALRRIQAQAACPVPATPELTNRFIESVFYTARAALNPPTQDEQEKRDA